MTSAGGASMVARAGTASWSDAQMGAMAASSDSKGALGRESMEISGIVMLLRSMLDERSILLFFNISEKSGT